MFSETVIIGSGLASLGAAVSFTKKGYNDFIIIESEEAIGGHLITVRNVENNNMVSTIDTTVQFGSYGHKTLLNLVQNELNLEIVPMSFIFSSADHLGNIVYQNNKLTKLREESDRFYKFCQGDYKWWWFLISFKTFCCIYEFSQEFVTYCIKPSMSVLMLMRDIYKENPILILTGLNQMVSPGRPNFDSIWTVYGGIGTIPQRISEKFNLKSKTFLNHSVSCVKLNENKTKGKYTIETSKGTFYCNKIISGVSAPIAKGIFGENTLNLFQNYLLKYNIEKVYTQFVTIIHRDSTVIPEENEITTPVMFQPFYHYENLENENWRSHGKLGYGYYLSASQEMYLLDDIKGEKRVLNWNYPMMDMDNVMFNKFYNEFLKLNKSKDISLIGGWTDISSMESSLKSGLNV